jgi:hypothetical protein
MITINDDGGAAIAHAMPMPFSMLGIGGDRQSLETPAREFDPFAHVSHQKMAPA